MPNDNAVISFGAFSLSPARRQLTRDGAPVPLGARAMDILLHLTANAGSVVSKQALMKAVWPDRIVEENNLTVNMTALRKALGGQAAGEPLIRTVTGRGYMFVGAVPASAAPPPAPAALSLPPAVALIGREAALAEIGRLLGEHRIVSIVGPGGVGKTVLAVHAARDAAANFADGAAFADLSTVSDPARVPEAVTAVLAGGAGAGAGVNTATARLTALLRDRRMLLVLDNCEHVVEPVAVLASAIVADCPGVTVLITSREGLFVQGEQIFRLAPLPIEDAVRLFVERARALDGVALAEANKEAVGSICSRLDGIPLAIEMAVPRLKVLSPAQLAERLDERFRLLGAPARGATPRHRTLQAVIDWSYDLLPGEERALLRSLSVFAGSAALSAVEAVAGGEAGVELINRLTALADKSMVVVDAASPPRFRLLETIRQYAVRKAAEARETALPARHAAHFADLFAEAARVWPTTPGRQWLATYAPDADNLRSALAWAFGADGDAALGVRLVASTVPLWWELPETPVAEGQRWLAAAAGRVGPDTPAEIQGWLRFGQSWRDFRFSDRENLPAALEAVAFLREAGDKAGLGAALWRAGSAALTSETIDQAESLLVEGEQVLRGLAPGKWLALTLIRLADLRFRQGRHVAALAGYQEGFALSRATDFWIGLVNGGSNMAELLLSMGEAERALRQLEALRDELPAGRRTPLMGTLTAHLLVAGNGRAMRAAARETIDQGSAIGLASSVAWTVEAIALLAASDGDFETAARLAGYARAVHPSLATRAGSLRVIAERLYEALDRGLSAEVRDTLMTEGGRWSLATAAARARAVLEAGPAD
ncbi:MAG TPA: winged helix-turn-helix domain-containing protein [Reyranella sp.]|nr:winged helix-turn-helix domain-containing protein [Reyranella sp.]